MLPMLGGKLIESERRIAYPSAACGISPGQLAMNGSKGVSSAASQHTFAVLRNHQRCSRLIGQSSTKAFQKPPSAPQITSSTAH
jgi:hypothetical protein